MSESLAVVDLGRQRYGDTLALQRELRRRRLAHEIADDLLLLVEHDPVITLGRGTKVESLPLAPAELEQHGIEVHEVERGGDVTYHGPGQLVGYPILDLSRHRQDLHWYLRRLEAGLIAALASLAVPAERSPGFTGVWTRGRKIASIGVHVKQWVTLHGFALNVTTNLEPFGLIVPCGIRDVVMTSVAAERRAETGTETGARADTAVVSPAALWSQARDAVIAAMGHVFERDPVQYSISVASSRPRISCSHASTSPRGPSKSAERASDR